jgi:hypothetical protein
MIAERGEEETSLSLSWSLKVIFLPSKSKQASWLNTDTDTDTIHRGIYKPSLFSSSSRLIETQNAVSIKAQVSVRASLFLYIRIHKLIAATFIHLNLHHHHHHTCVMAL